MEFHHVPVLLTQTIDLLNINPDGIYVDGTLGGGGHSYEICKKLKNGVLIGIDQDIEAINSASKRLAEFKARTIFVNDNFKNISKILENLKIGKVDGILLDIGVSSYQLDEGERGFSYQFDALLDMRMNRNSKLSAKEVINEYSEAELSKVIFEYGEERFAKRISRFIVEERLKKPIETTFELVEIIKKAIPASNRREGPHPAKRTFQAIRIEVNDELNVLKQAIEDSIDLLNIHGRLCIITFHSLEDRIVKEAFATLNNPCTCPPSFPVCVCKKQKRINIITRKPIVAENEELEDNPRARSAKLRGAERI